MQAHTIPTDTYLWDMVLTDLSVRDENGDLRHNKTFHDELEAEYQAAIDTVFAPRLKIYKRDGK